MPYIKLGLKDVMFLSVAMAVALQMQFIWPMIFIMVSALVVLGKDCLVCVLKRYLLIPVLLLVANDTDINIYAHQLEVKGREGDLLIVLSGSGNSANIVRVLETANSMAITSFAILAFSGGRCRELADTCIHFEINDMQIAEDTQLIVGHLCMQWLNSNKPSQLKALSDA